MLSVMAGCLQIGLRLLIKSFCHVKGLEDVEGNIIVDKNSEPQLKIPNPTVELPYTYLVA